MLVGFYEIIQSDINGVDSYYGAPWYNHLRFTENKGQNARVKLEDTEYYSAFRDYPEILEILVSFRPIPGMRSLNADYLQSKLENAGYFNFGDNATVAGAFPGLIVDYLDTPVDFY